MDERERQLALILFSPMVIRKLLEAENDDERERLVNEIPSWKAFCFEALERLVASITEIKLLEDKAKGEMLESWCERLIRNCVTGHSLEEGIVEYETIAVMNRIIPLLPEELREEARRKPPEQTAIYRMEVEMVRRIIELFGEHVVKAYPKNQRLLESQMNARFGSDAFTKLLLYSDFGQWEKVFELLSLAETGDNENG